MTDVIDLLKFEEGWRERPYLDSLGYPTVGYGVVVGPQGAPLSNYTFTLPHSVGVAWLIEHLKETHLAMARNETILKALESCTTKSDPDWGNPRSAVLLSMAYQMGVEGLAKFRDALRHISNRDWFQAETSMLKSRWANQTPHRARRHARQMRTGIWAGEYP